MTATEPRQAACFLLDALDAGGGQSTNLDRLFSETFHDTLRRMDRRDRNFVYALVYGTLRTRGRLDWIIARFSKIPVRKIEGPVLNILRTALYQVLYMDRVPESAAVHTAVENTKKTAGNHVVRFVNGLLRTALRHPDRIQWPERKKDPFLWLSVDQSFPEWMIRRWTKRYGFDETVSLCRYYNEIPPLTLRTNTLAVTPDALAAALAPHAHRVAHGIHTPESLRVYGLKPPVDELEAFRNGWFHVQDEAAQLVSHVTAPLPGETVMDACAGRGGKTAHLAQLMNNTGRIVAVDNHAKRREELIQQIQRLGITIVTPFGHNLDEGPLPGRNASFDRVQLDAPCSATGVIRRNPDVRWSIRKTDFARMGKRQLRFLKNVSASVRIGGILVYAVCSIEPEETTDVRDAFLREHPEFHVKPLSGTLKRFPGASPPDGLVCCLPHVHETDGFYIAAFMRKA